MDKPKIYVVLPWRHEPSRVRAFQEVSLWYDEHLPEAKVVCVTYASDIWLPSHTRNLGVRMAEEDGADIVILNDADTIPDKQALLKAIDAAMKDNLIHNPYNEYRFYDIDNTEKYFNTKSLDDCQYRIEHGSNGGIWVLKPSSWWLVGGMDEKFVKWGYEDTALEYTHTIIHGKPLVKHDGVIHAFDHHRTQRMQRPDQDLMNNFNRYTEYLSITNPEEILDFIRL